MSETQPDEIGDFALSFEKSTHAPLLQRYVSKAEGFVDAGDEPEAGLPWRLHPETGHEIHVLGGVDHRYSTDYEVGASYPPTVFITGRDAENVELDHDGLRAALESLDMWPGDSVNPVMLPATLHDGELGYMAAYQFRPPERAPRIRRVTEQLEERIENGHDILGGANGVTAYVHGDGE